jgi:hypothetical protein
MMVLIFVLFAYASVENCTKYIMKLIKFLLNYGHLTVDEHEFGKVNFRSHDCAALISGGLHPEHRWPAKQRNAESEQFAKMWS